MITAPPRSLILALAAIAAFSPLRKCVAILRERHLFQDSIYFTGLRSSESLKNHVKSVLCDK